MAKKHTKKMFYLITEIQITMGMLAKVLMEDVQNQIWASWCMLNGFCFMMIRFTILLIRDVKTFYPVNSLYTPKKFTKIFESIYEQKGIPRIFVSYVYLNVIFIIINTIFLTMTMNGNMMSLAIKNNDTFEDMLLTLDLVCVGILLVGFICVYYIVYFTIFLQRFKKINKHNIKYAVIFSHNRTYKWPLPKIIGRCSIVECQTRGKKTYVIVKMQESDEIVEEVLVAFPKDLSQKKYYKLHEICHVKYII